MQKWEYLILQRISTWRHDKKEKYKVWQWADDENTTMRERLNQLGQEGWELVGLVAYDAATDRVAGVTDSVQLIFKRPLQE